MLRDSDGAMLSRLLGLLVLSSLCSAMLLPNNTTEAGRDDPNTHYWKSSSVKNESSNSTDKMSMDKMAHKWVPAARSGGMPMYPEMSSGMSSEEQTSSEEQMPHWPPLPPHYNRTDRIRMTGNTDDPMMPPMFPMPPMSDSALCDMLMNSPVPPPLDQIPVACICWHCKGTVGPKGDRGDRGLPGTPGSPGRRGMTGFPGVRGFTGSQGIKGQKGDLGEKGQPGSTGFTGMKGGRGFKGDKGDMGMEGPPGSQGPQGETGACPASCESVHGPPGQQGPPGPAGPRGMTGDPGPMGPKGLMGDKGDQGTPGDPGMNGLKGDQGEEGMCECTNGTDGADGLPGLMGAKGDKGDTGAQGIQGPMGLKGDMGMMGLMGVPGPCSPTIQSAFTVAITQAFPKPDLPVPFPRVITNLMGNFNPQRGMYMAPVNGTYVFTFNLAVAGKPLKVALILNFQPVVIATESTDQSTTSQTVVLHLTMGDLLWLQVKDDFTNGMFTGYESSSTFSGYLLYQDSCDIPIGRDFLTMPYIEKEAFKWKDSSTTITNTTTTTTTSNTAQP